MLDAEDTEEMYMSGDDAKAYSGIVARVNYLVQDMSEIQFATKELSRTMANPKRID